MAGTRAYDHDYIASCRARDESQVAMFHEVVTAARTHDHDGGSDLEGALESLEAEYFNNLLIVLEGYFGDREREPEAANALGEVRRLTESLIRNGGTVAPLPAGTPEPPQSRLGLRAGDSVGLTTQQYQRLSNAFFAEIERHFTDPAG